MRRLHPRAASAVALLAALLLAGCADLFAPPPMPPRTPPPPPPPRPVARPEPVTPAEVRSEIERWFTKAGYRDFEVAAMVAHARAESGFRPCAAGAAGLRYTYQWGGTRLQRLYKFAGVHDCPALDWQLAFANDELRDEPKFACFWRATTASGALAALRRGFGRGSC